MKDLFDQLRDLPEPPLTPVAQALATARRAARRRTTLRVITAAAAAVLVASSAATLLVNRAPAPARPVAGPSTATPATDAPTTPPAPDEPAVHAHAAALTRLMQAAVPAGYTADPVAVGTSDASSARTIEIQDGSFRALTLVRVGRDGAAGTLSVIIGTDMPAPGADPCATARDLGIEGATVQDCTVTSVDGVPVRVVTGRDTRGGQVVSAVRYLRGGYLLVSFSQGEREYWVERAHGTTIYELTVDYGRRPALPTVPITTAQLVALAVNPATLSS